MKQKFTIIFIIRLLYFTTVIAQECITQTIRGSVKDKNSHIGIPGSNVAVMKDSMIIAGGASDKNGFFRIDYIPVGRYKVAVSSIGYERTIVRDIIVNSGKEVILELELEESVTILKDVEIVATQKHETINKMTSVSTRTFSVDESERYAGSRADPARMASNFAGCQGVDDSRNDIVIRGNSPLGVAWMLEGIDIPNPNHFAISGTAGGPVNILNNKVLSNSDFYTGAFPAEFGNSIAGVFDIKMRNGNNEKHEFTGQLGLLGTELTAEGPISRKNHSSYLLNYRYSTLALFGFMGINIGTSAIPQYQDAAFKLNFPLKNNANISLFGIGGLSNIDIMISEQKADDIEIYGETDRDQHFATGMGVAGINYTKSFNSTSYANITLATAIEQQKSHHELIYRTTDTTGCFIIDEHGKYLIDSIIDYMSFTFRNEKTSIAAFVNKKIKLMHVIKAGINTGMYRFNYIDSIYNDGTTYDWTTRWDYQGNAFLVRPYIQWKYKLTDKLVLNSGLHCQFFTLNNSFSGIEPRIGVRWDFIENQTLSLGFGRHSQLQPLYTYFYRKEDGRGSYILHNFNMDFTKSTHYVIGYDNLLFRNTRLKLEAYYQKLSNIPVEADTSSFSLVNQGSGFIRFFPDSLINNGTGENYGIEVTFEKFFSHKFFFIITGSLYNSKYRGSDNVYRDTDYNGNYILNFICAKEFRTGERSSVTIGTKITLAGNKRYGPVDSTQTILQGEIIYIDSLRNSLQFKDYFRTDIKINYKINYKKITHEIGLDLVNIFSTKNVLKLTYAPDPADPSANAIREEYQLGFLPLFYYRIDF
ncbi:MAG: TonB-dependent receptor [Bacteroidia bacterium]|nr:TonB-dependent receptor [Bacteroidia bacterium]